MRNFFAVLSLNKQLNIKSCWRYTSIVWGHKWAPEFPTTAITEGPISNKHAKWPPSDHSLFALIKHCMRPFSANSNSFLGASHFAVVNASYSIYDYKQYDCLVRFQYRISHIIAYDLAKSRESWDRCLLRVFPSFWCLVGFPPVLLPSRLPNFKANLTTPMNLGSILWDLTRSYSKTSYRILNDVSCYHDDVIKWKHFPRYWPFVRGIHRSPVNFPHKG